MNSDDILEGMVRIWTRKLREKVPDASQNVIDTMIALYRAGWQDCREFEK